MEDIKIGQLNLMHSRVAAENLKSLTAAPGGLDILLIQEPYYYKGFKLNPNTYTQFQVADQPRASIIFSKNLQVVTMTQLTTRDTACILWQTNNDQAPEILVCSTYLDITKDPVIYDIDKCLEYSKDNHIPILIGMDSNGHSQLWGCNENNSRGDTLELWIASNNLTLHNIGSQHTYEKGAAKTIIDITLSSFAIQDYIAGWKVNNEDYMSDHKMLNYNITVGGEPIQTSRRNFKKADWERFNKLGSKLKWVCPQSWNNDTIDTEADRLHTDIVNCLDKVCPVRKSTPKKESPLPYWTEELTNQRRLVKKKYNQHKKGKITRDNYLQSRKEYKKNILKAKKASWNEFISTEDIYKLNKIIHTQANKTTKVGFLKRADGTITNNMDESVKILLDTHLPDSTDVHVTTTKTRKTIKTKDLFAEEFRYLDASHLKKAINSFKMNKSPGLDDIKPIVLQNLPSNMIFRLSTIQKASMALGRIPPPWLESKTIFIPKPGKKSYDEAKSFRPITLSTFYFKSMEKLVLWQLQNTSLKDRPYHDNQHAFRTARGTDDALLQVTNIIEQGLNTGKFALGVFLDVQGAFDEINQDQAIKAMEERDFDSLISKWYNHYLQDRITKTDINNIQSTRHPTKGCPQGGVLSTLCWNIPFDELLKEVNTNGVKGIGFADDLCLLVTGIDPSTLLCLAQQVTDKAIEWGRKYGLTFNATKTVVVMFTHLRNWSTSKRLQINGTDIPYSDSVKYLGIYLDSKLTFKTHINNKIGKAKRHLMAYKNAINKKYGPSPILMKRVYETVIIPAFIYGCHVWGKAKKSQATINKLDKLNRLAAVNIAPVHKSTPTKGMEIIYNLMPLDIRIECQASQIMARIRGTAKDTWSGFGTNENRKGTIKRWDDSMRVITGGITITDRLPTVFSWNKNYKVHPPDKRTKAEKYSGINCYTDGSRLNDKTGCGIHIKHNTRVIYNGHFYLGTNTTVYQAEIIAIQKAATWLHSQEIQHQNITIHSDSQASLDALDKVTIHSKTVLACVEALNLLGGNNKLGLRWVKAHVGNHGNETADSLAKRGTTLGEGKVVGVFDPVINQKTNIKKFYTRRWNNQWKKYPEARQTKIWFPQTDKHKSKKLLQLNRTLLGKTVQFLTGHNNLMRHRHLKDNSIDPTCRMCQMKDETSFHVIAECEALWQTRRFIFFETKLSNPPNWTVCQVTRFLRESPIGELLVQHG